MVWGKAVGVLSGFAKRADAREFIDGPVDSIAELRASFRDIALANRWFGGTGAVKSALRGVTARTILDVGSGIADIPAALRENGREIVCTDLNPAMVELARREYGEDARMKFMVADGAQLPFEDRAFDVAMCNLSLHHFEPAAAVKLLAELGRVARTPIVTDLIRAPLTYAAVFAFSRIFSRNRLTRHDGPLSARRAYTLAEAASLAAHAGWRAPRVRRYGIIRLVLSNDADV